MWDQAREYDGYLVRRSQLEDADFIFLAETDVKDKATAGRILREGESEFEQKAQKELPIAEHHYTLTLLEKSNAPKS
jgi:hypothetical protein